MCVLFTVLLLRLSWFLRCRQHRRCRSKMRPSTLSIEEEDCEDAPMAHSLRHSSHMRLRVSTSYAVAA
eukprot:7191263-Pyramimonas_sp.AAC.1